jgi:hypothetical protein
VDATQSGDTIRMPAARPRDAGLREKRGSNRSLFVVVVSAIIRNEHTVRLEGWIKGKW